MADLLRDYLELIRFVYGLIFFTLGLAIVMQPRRNSVYFLATALSWLSAFALVHAMADWVLFWFHEIAPQRPFFQLMLLTRSMAIVISFGLLMQFGLSLLLQKHSRYRWLALVPSMITALFLLLLMLNAGPSDSESLLNVRIFVRYCLGLPASVLSAWGLLTQIEVLKRDRLGRQVGYLYGAAVCFLLYAAFAGLIAPAGSFFPASVINEETFFDLVGVPVEVARGLSVAGLTYFTVRLLDIFHLETQRRLQAAERDRALLWEREQIARELHDGIMQTLYGTGLGLKQMRNLAELQGPQAAILTELNREIGRAIVQMRRFVLDLREQSVTGSELADAVRTMVREVAQFAGVRISLETEFPESLETRVPAGVQEEILAILREGLSNVLRHSQAGEAHVLCSLEEDTALLRISDQGVGFEPGAVAAGRGLETARERVEALGGFLQVLSTPNGGTQLIAHLPVSQQRRGKGGTEDGPGKKAAAGR